MIHRHKPRFINNVNVCIFSVFQPTHKYREIWTCKSIIIKVKIYNLQTIFWISASQTCSLLKSFPCTCLKIFETFVRLTYSLLNTRAQSFLDVHRSHRVCMWRFESLPESVLVQINNCRLDSTARGKLGHLSFLWSPHSSKTTGAFFLDKQKSSSRLD